MREVELHCPVVYLSESYSLVSTNCMVPLTRQQSAVRLVPPPAAKDTSKVALSTNLAENLQGYVEPAPNSVPTFHSQEVTGPSDAQGHVTGEVRMTIQLLDQDCKNQMHRSRISMWTMLLFYVRTLLLLSTTGLLSPDFCR